MLSWRILRPGLRRISFALPRACILSMALSRPPNVSLIVGLHLHSLSLLGLHHLIHLHRRTRSEVQKLPGTTPLPGPVAELTPAYSSSTRSRGASPGSAMRGNERVVRRKEEKYACLSRENSRTNVSHSTAPHVRATTLSMLLGLHCKTGREVSMLRDLPDATARSV